MKRIKNLFLFLVIVGIVMYTLIYMPVVRNKLFSLAHIAQTGVLGISTSRAIPFSGQLQSSMNASLQTFEKQIGNVKVSDIINRLSMIQKSTGNKEITKKLIPSATPTPKRTIHK